MNLEKSQGHLGMSPAQGVCVDISGPVSPRQGIQLFKFLESERALEN